MLAELCGGYMFVPACPYAQIQSDPTYERQLGLTRHAISGTR